LAVPVTTKIDRLPNEIYDESFLRLSWILLPLTAVLLFDLLVLALSLLVGFL
jgi:hypothetical protein